MNKRFVDNETLLNAETLNKFEEDMKRAFSFPVYKAVNEDSAEYNVRVYRISEVNWSDIPIGSIFSVILDQPTKGDSNEVIGFRFGEGDVAMQYLLYSTPDYRFTFKNTEYVRVDNRKYLLANRPYLIKKLAETGSTTPLISLLDHFDTSKFATTLETDQGKLSLKNLDGTVISSADLPYGVEGAEVPKASQTEFGTSKIWLTGTTLNISTK